MATRIPKIRAGQRALPKSNAPVGHSWQLQTAKARFSEVFRLALANGPQLITRGGREAVVVLPAAQFDALVARSQQPKSLVEFFKRSPLAGLDLKLERDRDSGRDIEL
jgi:prevent-host-death family protein